MSQSGIVSSKSAPSPPSVATSYVEDSGTAVPALNVLKVKGDSNIISTSGSGNTITISSASSVPTSFTTNSGTAIPSANVLQVNGDGVNITTSGSGNTITITGSTPFTPNKTVQLYDDFIGQVNGSLGTSCYSSYTWQGNATNNNATGSELITNGHPGVIENASLGAGANWSLFLQNVNTNPFNTFVLGGGILVINWVFNIRALSNSTNRYILDIGLGDTNSAADQVNGCYFEYSDNINSAQWDFKTANASSRTTSTSSVTVTTGWHNAQITVNAAASSVSFVMDGVSLGTAISTNIPTASICPMFNAYRSAGTIAANSLSVDLFYLNQTLTTPR